MKPILIILLIALVLGNNIQKEKNPIFRALKGCVNQKNYDRCRSTCHGMLHLICKKDCYNAWCL
jgi:hypothetical protein